MRQTQILPLSFMRKKDQGEERLGRGREKKRRQSWAKNGEKSKALTLKEK